MRFLHPAVLLALALCVAPRAHAGDAVVADEFEQPQQVDACTAYGPGFARLKGTNTCVRVSGQVRIEKHYSNRGGTTGAQATIDFETHSD